MEQMTLWEYLYDTKTIDKPIRLIELFAGIGSQYKAIKQLTDKVESWKICEWAYNSYCCYNSIHHKDFTDYANGLSKEELIKGVKGTSINYNEPLTEEQLNKKSIEWLKYAYNNIKATHNLVNIMEVKGDDLEIVDTDKYEYILTYSFPCQDLSLAGNQKGMSVSQKEGGTRSGLLWEVERILTELYDSKKSLPQILLMENVPEVCGSKNVNDFAKWQLKLTQLGYQNYVEILNAKDYGIPQNRKRCFMISVLGDYSYSFPRKLKLELKLKDMLEKSVDEKYYLSRKTLSQIANWNSYQNPLDKVMGNESISPTITTRIAESQDGGINASMKVLSTELETDTNLKPTFESVIDKINSKSFTQARERIQDDDIHSTLMARDYKDPKLIIEGSSQPSFIAIKNNTEKGYLEAEEGDGVNIQGRMQYQRGNVQKESIPTLTTMGGNDIVVVKETDETFIEDRIKKYIDKNGELPEMFNPYNCSKIKDVAPTQTTQCGNTGSSSSVLINETTNLRIRKLTPKECMRLMSFRDTDFQACKDICMSDSAIYHIAGDSIVVCVLIALFSKLFTDKDHTEIIKKYIDEIKEK